MEIVINMVARGAQRFILKRRLHEFPAPDTNDVVTLHHAFAPLVANTGTFIGKCGMDAGALHRFAAMLCGCA